MLTYPDYRICVDIVYYDIFRIITMCRVGVWSVRSMLIPQNNIFESVWLCFGNESKIINVAKAQNEIME